MRAYAASPGAEALLPDVRGGVVVEKVLRPGGQQKTLVGRLACEKGNKKLGQRFVKKRVVKKCPLPDRKKKHTYRKLLVPVSVNIEGNLFHKCLRKISVFPARYENVYSITAAENESNLSQALMRSISSHDKLFCRCAGAFLESFFIQFS